jgi:hypothetical protein
MPKYRKGESGNPKGRPKGAKDLVPRGGKQSVIALMERFGSDTASIGHALREGLAAKAPSSFPYLRLIIEHQVGAPEQPIDFTKKIVHVHERSSNASS